MKPYLAELLGTFILVFAGTGAIVINDLSGGGISHLGHCRDVRSGRDGHDLHSRRCFRGAS